MKLSQLLQAVADLDRSLPDRRGVLRIQPSGTVPDVEIAALSDDSRRVGPGTLFVAIRGEKIDGHTFIDAAQRAGAAVIVGEHAGVGTNGSPYRVVSNARRFLALAGSVWQGLPEMQRAGELPVVGITGTNGKSTTALITQAMLNATGRPTALFGTIVYDLVGRKVDAPMTTPAPLELCAMLAEAHRHGARAVAMEVSSHSLEQCRADGAHFKVGVFTNLTGDHLDYHGTQENYCDAKRRLFELLGSNAMAVVNGEDPAAAVMLADCRARAIRFGFDGHVELRARLIEMSARGSQFEVSFGNRRGLVDTPLLGRHNVLNLLAAIGAGLGMDLDLETACLGASRLRNVRGRLERVDTGNLGFGIVVDYAHTDDALRNVLAAMRPITQGKLICVFGCGGDRDRTKRPRMARVAAELADRVIVTSDNPRTENPDAIIAEIRTGFSASDLGRCVFEPQREAAIHAAVQEARPGDTVLIAGKGHETYQIVGTTKIHFDDVEIAAAAVARWSVSGSIPRQAV